MGTSNPTTWPLDPPQRVASRSEPRGFSQITSLSAAAGLGSVPARSTVAIVECESQQVRWRDDGTNPTTTVGHVMSPGDVLTYDGDLSAIKFIEVTASAKLNVSFYA